MVVMKEKNLHLTIGCLSFLAIIILSIVFASRVTYRVMSKHPIKDTLIMVDTIYLYEEELNKLPINKDNFLKVCKFYGVKEPNIVTAQAILESGNFKSDVFLRTNNPLGLYDSKNKEYFKFKHWTEAIIAYRIYVESKYKGGDYYKFLNDLPYAEDPNYVSKIKNIEKL